PREFQRRPQHPSISLSSTRPHPCAAKMCASGRSRTGELRAIIHALPATARYSETFDLPLADLQWAVREHQLEGIVATRAGSRYRSGERCEDWLMLYRANLLAEILIVTDEAASSSATSDYY